MLGWFGRREQIGGVGWGQTFIKRTICLGKGIKQIHFMGDLHSVGERYTCSTNLARKVMDIGNQAHLLDTSGLHRAHAEVFSSFIAHPSVIILNQINANKIEW